jgi:hypothetical protein
VLVPAGDVRRFADETASLLDDPTQRAALGSTGRNRVHEELCWEQQAGTYLAVIHDSAERARETVPAARTSAGQ